MIELKQPTLRELVKKIDELSKDFDVDIHLEGKGDGTVKLVILEKAVTIVPVQNYIDESD